MSADGLSGRKIRLLQPGDRVKRFSLGDAQFQPLKTFLVRDSMEFLKQLPAQSHVVAGRNAVPACATLICGEITAEKEIADMDEVKFRYGHFPAVKTVCLAVELRYRSHGCRNGVVRQLQPLPLPNVQLSSTASELRARASTQQSSLAGMAATSRRN